MGSLIPLDHFQNVSYEIFALCIPNFQTPVGSHLSPRNQVVEVPKDLSGSRLDAQPHISRCPPSAAKVMAFRLVLGCWFRHPTMEADELLDTDVDSHYTTLISLSD